MNKEIKRLEEMLTNFKYARGLYKNKKELQDTYDRLKDIPDDLELFELKMIWQLRQLDWGDEKRFSRLVQRYYDTKLATDELSISNEPNKLND